MKLKTKLIFFISVLIIFNSCIKRKLDREQENQQILEFITSLNLDFYTTDKGIYYHIEYQGFGDKIKNGDSVSIVYNGYNLDKQEFFVKNDTFNFIYGQEKLHLAWEEILPLCSEGAVGIIIVPYYLAYENNTLPNLPANSTIVFYFRILSKDKLVNNMSYFYEFVELHRDTFDIATNDIFIHTIFEGIGQPMETKTFANVEIKMKVLNDTNYFFESENYFLDLNDPNELEGLKKGVQLINDGTMATIFINPQMGYGANPPFDIPEFAPLEVSLRVLSDDPFVAEDSNIKKFFYLNDVNNADTLPNGVIMIDSTDNQFADNPKPKYNDTIILDFKEKIINKDFYTANCSDCQKTLNYDNFVKGLVYGIENLPLGGKAYFIVPYKLAYDSLGTGAIPPYSTMLYFIELKNIL